MLTRRDDLLQQCDSMLWDYYVNREMPFIFATTKNRQIPRRRKLNVINGIC